MDGKGRAMDNIMGKRQWRSVKYPDIYLKDYNTTSGIFIVEAGLLPRM